MNRRHQRTLEAIFAHPLRHGLRASDVVSLCEALGARVSSLTDHRLIIRMPGGEETWLAVGEGMRHPDLDADALLRLRHLLSAFGVGPDHPSAWAPLTRGDRSLRLVLHLSPQSTEVFKLVPSPDGDAMEHSLLKPHGVWGSGENLSHRHDRDQAGQRAPRDTDYLARITAVIASAEAVLLLGHGTGRSDFRQVLLHYLTTHRPDLLDRIVDEVTVDGRSLGPEGLLAVARRHFGNQPPRRLLIQPGREPGPP